jgi:hypothetical protein
VFVTAATLIAPLASAQPPSEEEAETAAEATPQPSTAARDPALSLYLMHMRTAGLLDNTEASLEELEGLLQAAQDRYVAGDALGSAILLFELSHNPRYGNFQGLPLMESVNFHLGVALQSHGAELTSLEAYGNVLAAGPQGSYFRPALRRHVDIALASKDFPRGLAELDLVLRTGNVDISTIDPIDASERHYLEARTLHLQGKPDLALEAFGRIDEKSRFYTAARYLQGLIHSSRRDFRAAEAAFCDVVGGKYNSTSVYYVDARYFPVRDLAQLGLGRVAHEERRHGHAFYHYFQIPEESEELPSALYEAAWTMAEEGEHAVARGLVKDLRERFPNAPQSAEARLLDAMLALYDCDFREAEDSFEQFIKDLAPVADNIEAIVKEPTKIRALHEEMLRLRSSDDDLSGEPVSHRLLLSMLDEDPNYSRISHQAAVLRREASFAGAIDIELERVRAKLVGEKTTIARRPGGDALDAIATARDLERAIAGLEKQIREAEAAGADPESLKPERESAKRMKTRVKVLAGEAEKLAQRTPPVGEAQVGDLVGVVDQDRARIQSLRANSLQLASGLDDAAASYAAGRLVRLKARIEDLMGEARMGRIDAVLGAKKKLEIEVQSMAAGRFPSELFGKLQIEGMVGDDEEFWPYEGEYWADEYEDYR